jgi:hypothetical protein
MVRSFPRIVPSGDFWNGDQFKFGNFFPFFFTDWSRKLYHHDHTERKKRGKKKLNSKDLKESTVVN